MALAQAIIEYVHNRVHAKTLFSTHYHELTALDQTLPQLRNIHVGATEENGELVFLHQIQDGPADKSYGIHVAKLAGMPEDLLKRATAILSQLEQRGTTDSAIVAAGAAQSEQPKTKEAGQGDEQASLSAEDNGQLELFKLATKKPEGPDQKIIEQLRDLNLMSMTPMDVMNKIYQWQQQLK